MAGGALAPYGFGVPFFVISLLAMAFTPIAWLSLPHDGDPVSHSEPDMTAGMLMRFARGLSGPVHLRCRLHHGAVRDDAGELLGPQMHSPAATAALALPCGRCWHTRQSWF